MTICTDRFASLAEAARTTLGLPDLPVVIVPHPLAGLLPEAVNAKADSAIDEIIARLIAKA